MRYTFGDYVLDTQRAELQGAGGPIKLRRKVFHVLAYLLAHHDRVVPKEELLEQLWPEQFVGDETLKSCLKTLRQALGDRGRSPRFVRTLHGQGYRFVAPVEAGLDAPPGTAPPPSLPAPSLPAANHPPLPATEAFTVASTPCLSVPSFPLPTELPSPFQHPPAGERRQVTVLCGTLAHATTLADRLGFTTFRHLMQTFHALAHECVQRYEGCAQPLGEEGFLALFGVPAAQEEHAWCAVRAALELLQRLREASPGDAFLPEEGLTARIGVHTGWVVVGSPGDAPQQAMVVGGDTVQGAMRVQGLAEPGTLVVSDTTLRLLHAPMHSAAYGLVQIPGHTESLMAYTIQGIEAPYATRVWSPFVGRQRELALLDDLLARALDGQGQVVGIVGEPGIGKSRLLAEFRERLQDRAVTVLESSCRASSRFLPYGPISELLRRQCRLGRTVDPDVIATQMARLLQEVGLAPEDSAPYLLPLLGGSATAEPLAHLEPAVIKERTFAVLQQVHLRTSQQHPLLLVVDNLHWIDPTSEAYLATLVDQLAGVPLLLLTTSRPGYRPRWLDKSYATQLTLPPLSRAESAAVVDAVLPPDQYAAALVQRILTRAEGNPLFLEELAYAVRDQGGLAADTPVPETLQAVLAARIDRLPPATKHLLYTAAVIGPEVPVPLLAAIAELPQDVLQRRLGHLQAAEFLYATRLVPAPAYTFKHALTHEVAYGSLVQEWRRTLHGRLVDILEALSEDRVADQLDRLAYHALHGERWDKALAYCRQVGARAFGQAAYQEAVEYFEQARTALAHLPSDRPTMEQAIDLYGNLGAPLLQLRRFEQRLTYLRAAEALAHELADQHRLAEVYNSLVATLLNMQELEPALAYCQQGLAMATALGDHSLQVRLQYHMGVLFYHLGDYRQAMAYLQQTLTTLAALPPGTDLRLIPARHAILARLYMVLCLSQVGDFAAGVTYGNAALQLAEAGERPYERMAASLRLGTLYVYQGALHRAIPLLERAIALLQDTNVPIYYRPALVTLAWAYALAGRVPDARAMLEQVGGQMEQVSLNILLACGEAYLRTGNVEVAHRLAQRVLADARHHKARGWEAWALWLLGEVAMHGDPLDMAAAEAHYRQSLTLAEELGMRPHQAHCHLGLGTLYARTGQQAQAGVALSAAIELYRAMEMTFWLPQAEAALAQVT